MTDCAYCYHCRCHHPVNEMTLVVVRGRQRWRCKKSLQARVLAQSERDEYGALMRAQNQQQTTSRSTMTPLPHCVADLIYPKSLGRHGS